MLWGICFFTIKYEIKKFYLLNPALQIERRPVQFLHNGGYKFNSCRLWLPGLQQHEICHSPVGTPGTHVCAVLGSIPPSPPPCFHFLVKKSLSLVTNRAVSHRACPWVSARGSVSLTSLVWGQREMQMGCWGVPGGFQGDPGGSRGILGVLTCGCWGRFSVHRGTR